ncbi:MAG: alpha-amylase [Akkermansiaceae bacterium]|nr:alpha-amylase [Akkermansiaceae bacterium]
MKYLLLAIIFAPVTLHAVDQTTRPHIYQLMVRHFGNTNETRKTDGTMAENGCGKFDDINDAALKSIKELGITHIWLTGVLEQASSTAYPDRPADNPILVKGKAGSPYAIRDYFDVCPDYATVPANRLDEFRALLKRIEKHGLKAIIDFVPNHVARSYSSDVRPELSFGKNDDTGHFFNINNNFFYLGDLHPGGGAPLKLPTKDGQHVPYEPESKHGKVTGNNVISWSPSINDWFETIKLNYGHDFTLGPPRDDLHPLPKADAKPGDTPDTWRKMDAILAYWQDMGVDGFRVDMAHMVPMAYWSWQTQRCKARDEKVFFMAEAYDNDPSKLTEGNVLEDLLTAGFDAVYDDPTYDTIKHTVEGQKWANDIDGAANPFSNLLHKSLRYAENHDEVRLASKGNWAGSGREIGIPVSAILFGLGRGPIMLYSGQEVGEAAEGAEGFSGDDGRSSIFDYWSLPSMTPWVNNHRYDGAKLTAGQKDLRSFYSRLINTCAEPAFTRGDFYGLNHANQGNEHYGRTHGEAASGHWLYSFLRRDQSTGQAFLVVANLNPNEALSNVHIQIPDGAIEWLGGKLSTRELLTFTDRLGSNITLKANDTDLPSKGLVIDQLPAKAALYLEIE